MNVLSLFSGYGGLDMAVSAALGAEVLAFCEYEPPGKNGKEKPQFAARVLAHRYPDVPNLGDITKIDWPTVGPVDVICGGFPCQDISSAGKRAGIGGKRSGLWSHFTDAISSLRPRFVVVENVSALVVRGLDRVLADLAALGLDAEWASVRASDIGAPHRRERLFILATTDASGGQSERRGESRNVASSGGCPEREAPQRQRGRNAVSDSDPTTTDAESAGLDRRTRQDAESQRRGERSGRNDIDGRCATTDATDDGHERAGEAWDRRARLAYGGGSSAADTASTGPQRPRPESSGRRPQRSGSAPADTASDGRHERRPELAGEQRRPESADGSGVALADAGGLRLERHRQLHSTTGEDQTAAHGRATADTDRGGRGRDTGDSGRPTVERTATNRDRTPGGGREVIDFGPYQPAIDRWASIIGRPAPHPATVGARGARVLNPRFVEWMMGLPDGWVTDVPSVTRNGALHVLGNGVVPQQAAYALRLLLRRSRLGGAP